MSVNITEHQVAKLAFNVANIVVSSHSQSLQQTEEPVFIKQASLLTGYTVGSIYGLIHRNEIPFHKTAGRKKLFFYKSELLTWMNSKKEASNV
jgi:excisionase family DNA binding protein